MAEWSIILAVGLGTYLLRASMFVFVGSRPIPAWARTPMAYIGPAAVGALLASMLLTSGGERAPRGAAELVAAAAAFAVVRRTGNVTHAFVVGLPVLWALHALQP